MKEWRYNRFECCGVRVSKKYKFCPLCGQSIDYKTFTPEIDWVLDELDRRASGCEKVSQTYKAKIPAASDSVDIAICRGGASGNAKAALTWRRMFKIVHNLAQQRQTPKTQTT